MAQGCIGQGFPTDEFLNTLREVPDVEQVTNDDYSAPVLETSIHCISLIFRTHPCGSVGSPRFIFQAYCARF
jgi:hypothetical protein